MNSLRKSVQAAPRLSSFVRSMSDKPAGSMGSAGAIRDAGGAFAKMEIAHEEEYFYKQRHQQLMDLKAKKIDKLQFHEKAVRDHEDAIKVHKEAIKAHRNK